MKKLLITIVAISALWGCEKTKVDSNPETLLTNGTVKSWKITELSENGKSILLDCYADDLFYFSKTKNEYFWQKNAKKCGTAQSDPDITWPLFLAGDGKSVLLNNQKWDIEKLDAKNFKMSTNFSTIKIEATYVAL